MAESELEKTLRSETELAKVLTSEFEKLGLTIAQQNKIISKASAANSKDTRKRKEDLESLIDNESELSDAVKERSKAETEANRKAEKGYRELKETMKEMPDVWKGVGKSSRATFTKVRKDLEKEFSKTIASLQKNSKAGIYDANSFLTAKDQKTVIKRLNEIDDAMNEIDDRTVGKHFLDNITKAKKLSSGIFKDKTGNTMRGSGATLQEMGKVSGGVKGAIQSTVGSGMMGAAKFMPGIGAAISIGSLLLDALNAADKLMVDSRKSYASVGGVQFNGGTFANRSTKYNEEIRDVGRNVRLGTRYTEWEGMFKSMSGAGATLDVIEHKFGSLGNTMESVKKTSLLLGVSTEIVGEAYASQAQELNASLETIRDGMLDVARGAKVAGVESSKFYQNIVSTTMALASFGNFTKAAAASQAALSKNYGTSKQEGADTSKKMFEQFSDTERNLKLAATLDGAILKKIIDDKIKEIEEQIAKSNNDEEKLTLKAQLKPLEGARDKDYDKVAVANAMQYVPDAGMKVLLSYLKKIMGNKSMTEFAQTPEGIAARGLLPGLFDPLVRQFTGIETAFEGASKFFDKIITSKNDPNNKNLKELSSILKEGKIKDEKDLLKVKGILDSLGLSSTDLAGLLNELNTDYMTFGKYLSEAIESGKPIDLTKLVYEQLENSSKSGRGINKILKQEKVEEQVKNLTLAKDYLDIAKDSLMYDLSDNDLLKFAVSLLKTISIGVAKIVSFNFFGKGSAEKNEQLITEIRQLNEDKNKSFKEDKGTEGITNSLEDSLRNLEKKDVKFLSNKILERKGPSGYSLQNKDFEKMWEEAGGSNLSDKSTITQKNDFISKYEEILDEERKKWINKSISLKSTHFEGSEESKKPWVQESKAYIISTTPVPSKDIESQSQSNLWGTYFDEDTTKRKAPFVITNGNSGYEKESKASNINITVNTRENLKPPSATYDYAAPTF